MNNLKEKPNEISKAATREMLELIEKQYAKLDCKTCGRGPYLAKRIKELKEYLDK